jgi:hypothetical protein
MVLFGVVFSASLALSGAQATPIPGTYEITANSQAVNGSASPIVGLSSITGAASQQWIWNGATFVNIQSGAGLQITGMERLSRAGPQILSILWPRARGGTSSTLGLGITSASLVVL